MWNWKKEFTIKYHIAFLIGFHCYLSQCHMVIGKWNWRKILKNIYIRWHIVAANLKVWSYHDLMVVAIRNRGHTRIYSCGHYEIVTIWRFFNFNEPPFVQRFKACYDTQKWPRTCEKRTLPAIAHIGIQLFIPPKESFLYCCFLVFL